MAAYNAEKTIAAAIESVRSQTYHRFELIVINDCSTDSTKEIVENYKMKDYRIKLINNDKNCGVSYSRHVGLVNSFGNYIAILDSDDYWIPSKLEKQVNAMLQHNALLSYTGVSYVDEFNVHKKWIMHIPCSINYKSLLYQNVITNSSALIEKNIYIECESMGDYMHEDYACWLRVLRKEIKTVGIDEPLLVYRVSSKSKSGNKIKSGIMIWNTYRFIGLDLFRSLFYLLCYMYNGLKKQYLIKYS